MNDLLVIVPSRGRPGNIARMTDSIKETCQAKTDLTVMIDDDDPELKNYEFVMSHAKDFGKLIIGPRKGLTDWTNEIAAKEAGNYSYLASFGDDHVPITKGWDRLLIRAIERMGGTGFSYPYDGMRDDIPEAVVVSSDIVRALGWMAMPELSHWYIDNVWADLGRGIDRLKYLRAVKVSHDWKADQTSKDSSAKLTIDRDVYFRWRKERMAADIAILAGLIK
jgi:hypothetical protein